MKPGTALIFSDLDGSLLDHDDYRHDAALPALHAIRERAIPLILATSKTLAEVAPLNRQLDNHQAVIVENGGAICFPLDVDFPFALPPLPQQHGHAVLSLAAGYPELRAFLSQQRAAGHLQLQGFGDMNDPGVAQLTGLGLPAAARARQRLCSEPFVWLDDSLAIEGLRRAAAARGLRLTRGGRFWHLMGDTDKATAMLRLRQMFAAVDDRPITLIALGDSENDREMLRQADIAVIVRRPDHSHLDSRGMRHAVITDQAGPTGWNQAVLQLLQQTGITGPVG